MKTLSAILILLISGVAMAAPPHLVIYLSDDLGRLDTAVYGSTDVRTPNLERLAAVGVTFDKAFVASPACAPSRAALLTGLMPARNGAEANHTYPRPGTAYLTTALKQAGYEIAAFGKVSHGQDKPEYGFDHYSHPRVNLPRHVTDYIKQRRSGGPLCLMVGDRRPHVPWTVDNVYDPQEVTLPPYFIDTPETREHRARYYSDITGLDADMGQILETVRQELGENVVVLFTSDHGGQWPFGKWNLYDAGIHVPLIVSWPGQISPGTRTEAMVSWVDILPTLLDLAGAEAPRGIDGESFAKVLTAGTQAHRSDIYTTHSGDGVMNVYPIRSLRTDRHKYILNLLPDHYHSNHSDILRKERAGAYWTSWYEAAGSDAKAAAIIERYYVRPAEELYDLEEDPLEQNNLASDPDHQELLVEMRSKLERWMEAQGDQRTVFNDPYPVSGPRPTAKMLGRD